MLLAKNRKALFNNKVEEKFIAGIVLHGYEVKAIREGKVSFEGSYITVLENEVFIKNLYIGRYSHQSQEVNEDSQNRLRKLLVSKREILKIKNHLSHKGKTAVPLALILRNNYVKLEFALVKGLKKFEKKVVAVEREQKKELDRMLKNKLKGM
jgi:SsrA-binding protein